MIVPWNASWTAEQRFEIRPCKWAYGQLALWSPFAPGEGKPVFAKPHPVRQRMSIASLVCTVCGEPTSDDDRWWFGHGERRGGTFMTQEAPVHRACAEKALKVCPHLRGSDHRLSPMPPAPFVLGTYIGGPAVKRDFGVTVRKGQKVVGSLKLAWQWDHVAQILMEMERRGDG